MGFPELKKKKKIGSIIFVPGIYPYVVGLLTPIHFRVASLIFGPLVGKYLAENGVSGTFFYKTVCSIHFILGISLMGWVSWNLFWIFLDEVGSAGIYCPIYGHSLFRIIFDMVAGKQTWEHLSALFTPRGVAMPSWVCVTQHTCLRFQLCYLVASCRQKHPMGPSGPGREGFVIFMYLYLPLHGDNSVSD